MFGGGPGLPLSASAGAPGGAPAWHRRLPPRCSRSGAAAALLLLALSGLLLNATLPFWLGAGGVEALQRQLGELEARSSPGELQAAFRGALQAAGAAPSAGGAAFAGRTDAVDSRRAASRCLQSLATANKCTPSHQEATDLALSLASVCCRICPARLVHACRPVWQTHGTTVAVLGR